MIPRNINTKQMDGWLAKIEQSFKKFEQSTEATEPEAQLNFIREQTQVYATVTKVLEGRAYFVGTSHIQQ